MGEGATPRSTKPVLGSCTRNVPWRHLLRNMRYWLKHDMGLVELALGACRRVGVGVPTPNLFTGMQ